MAQSSYKGYTIDTNYEQVGSNWRISLKVSGPKVNSTIYSKTGKSKTDSAMIADAVKKTNDIKKIIDSAEEKEHNAPTAPGKPPTKEEIIKAVTPPTPAPKPTTPKPTTPVPTPSAPSSGGWGPSSYTGTSIDEYLKSKGKATGFANRKIYAKEFGIANYTGTAAQNIDLLKKMRAASGTATPLPVVIPSNPESSTTPTAPEIPTAPDTGGTNSGMREVKYSTTNKGQTIEVIKYSGGGKFSSKITITGSLFPTPKIYTAPIVNNDTQALKDMKANYDAAVALVASLSAENSQGERPGEVIPGAEESFLYLEHNVKIEQKGEGDNIWFWATISGPKMNKNLQSQSILKTDTAKIAEIKDKFKSDVKLNVYTAVNGTYPGQPGEEGFEDWENETPTEVGTVVGEDGFTLPVTGNPDIDALIQGMKDNSDKITEFLKTTMDLNIKERQDLMLKFPDLSKDIADRITSLNKYFDEAKNGFNASANLQKKAQAIYSNENIRNAREQLISKGFNIAQAGPAVYFKAMKDRALLSAEIMKIQAEEEKTIAALEQARGQFLDSIYAAGMEADKWIFEKTEAINKQIQTIRNTFDIAKATNLQNYVMTPMLNILSSTWEADLQNLVKKYESRFLNANASQKIVAAYGIFGADAYYAGTGMLDFLNEPFDIFIAKVGELIRIGKMNDETRINAALQANTSLNIQPTVGNYSPPVQGQDILQKTHRAPNGKTYEIFKDNVSSQFWFMSKAEERLGLRVYFPSLGAAIAYIDSNNQQ